MHCPVLKELAVGEEDDVSGVLSCILAVFYELTQVRQILVIGLKVVLHDSDDGVSQGGLVVETVLILENPKEDAC